MDITRILEDDHRSVEHLFAQIDEAAGQARQRLLDELARNLKGHMELEEETLYPAMAPVTGKEPVEEGNNEHQLVRDALADMLRLAPDEPGFGAGFEAVKAAIAHHVEEEEGDVFPKLRKQGKRVLEEVATPFMTKRLELGLPMEPPALAAAFTKEELVEEADKAGIDGAPSMKKGELAEAIAGVMR